MKNALDYCPRGAFNGKYIGLISIAGGRHTNQTINTLRNIVDTLQGMTFPLTVGANGHSFSEEAELLDEARKECLDFRLS